MFGPCVAMCCRTPCCASLNAKKRDLQGACALKKRSIWIGLLIGMCNKALRQARCWLMMSLPTALSALLYAGEAEDYYVANSEALV